LFGVLVFFFSALPPPTLPVFASQKRDTKTENIEEDKKRSEKHVKSKASQLIFRLKSDVVY